MSKLTTQESFEELGRAFDQFKQAVYEGLYLYQIVEKLSELLDRVNLPEKDNQ